MLSNVRVINDRGIDKLLVLNKATDGVKITEVKGLGPVDADIKTTSRAGGASGVNYNSHHIGSRNIVLSLALSRSGAKAVDAVRRDVYSYFPIGKEVDFRFEYSGVIYQIIGRIESVTPEIFTKEPSVQVSAICVEPNFKIISGTNSSVIIPDENIDVTVSNYGLIDTGIRFEIEVIDVPPPTIYGLIEFRQDFINGIFKGFKIYDFDIAGATGGVISRFAIGDKIIIETTPGKKEATIVRNGVAHNIMGTLKNDAGYFLTTEQWPYLSVGIDTTFRYDSTIYSPAHLKVTVSWDTLVEGL